MYPEMTSDYYAHYGVAESGIDDALTSVVELQAKTDAINLTDLTGSAKSPNFLIAQKAVIKGLNKQFNGETDYGKYIITGCSYSFDRSLDFRCQFSGISSESSLPENTNPNFIIKSSPQVAIVTDNKDPEKLGRIKVRFPWMKDETHWINVNTPYTQKSAGFYFIPSQHSHVMINFEGGDIDRPYCEGAFYEKNVAPDEEWVGNADKQNAKILGIRTFKGNTIEFHDSDGEEKIRIYDTNRKNEIILNSADGVLDIIAQGSMNINVGGSLKITANDIEIKADAGIGIEAGASLKQEGASVEMSSSSSFKIKGASVEIKGEASLTAEGSGTAELKSGGVTSVSGSLVKIN
jgi:type VI secretion system secreted protein VgrG